MYFQEVGWWGVSARLIEGMSVVAQDVVMICLQLGTNGMD